MRLNFGVFFFFLESFSLFNPFVMEGLKELAMAGKVSDGRMYSNVTTPTRVRLT